MSDPQEPTVVQVVGTAEFTKAWDAIRAIVDSILQDGGHFHGREASALMEAANAACRQAYLDGFDEGLSK